MARLIFCFFAEDTGIFHGDGLFTATIQQMSEADGSNTRDVLLELFRAMNLDPRKKGERDGVRPWADVFPFVNVGLFQDEIGWPEVHPHLARLPAAGGRARLEDDQPRYLRLHDPGRRRRR